MTENTTTPQESNEDTQSAAQANATPQNSNEKMRKEEEYLAESVRLAELKLVEFFNSVVIMERKALLLTTACVALIGYLLTTEQGAINILFETIRIIALVILSVAAVIGGMVIDIAATRLSGLNPQVTKHFQKYSKDKTIIEMHEHLLTEYQERITENKNISVGKGKKLNVAKWVFVVGLISSVCFEIVTFIDKFCL